MGKLLETLRKTQEFFGRANNSSSQHPRLTSQEVELASFKRREYLDNVKKQLYTYRKKNSDELIRGKPMDTTNTIMAKIKPRHNIMAKGKSILDNDHRILQNHNILNQRSKIL